MDYAGLRDDELMDCLGRQDIRAFEALYDRYGDLVYSVALRVVGDPPVAQDINRGYRGDSRSMREGRGRGDTPPG